MTTHKDSFAKNFFKCGLTGWCMEIIFTSLHSISQKDLTLKGVTSIWMFPIYGCAALIAPVSRKLSGIPMVFRGLIYMTAIFTVQECCSADIRSAPGTMARENGASTI